MYLWYMTHALRSVRAHFFRWMSTSLEAGSFLAQEALANSFEKKKNFERAVLHVLLDDFSLKTIPTQTAIINCSARFLLYVRFFCK